MRFLILLTIVFNSSCCFAQMLNGKLQLNDSWKPIVYLIEVNNYQALFSGSSDNVVDSFFISTEGYFYFSKLKKNTLYRLNVVPKANNVSGALIQDGSNDNYAFFVTGNENKNLFFTGNIAKLYRSYRLISDDNHLNSLQKEVLSIRQIKMPNYDSMQALGKQMERISPSDTAALSSFQHQAILKLQAVNEGTNRNLFSFLKSVSNPQIIALGLIFADFEQYTSDKNVTTLIDRLEPYYKQPLVKSIIDATKKSNQKIANSFLSKNYKLINGGSVRLDTITSKFILLDFWASWCMPCRKDLRTTIKALSVKYNRAQLQIIGINDEDDKLKPLQAIKADKNPYPQIWDSDTKYLQSLFEVRSIPFYVLINTETKESVILKNAELIEGKLDGQ